MSTPDAVKYAMTHTADFGVLPNTSVPTYLSRSSSAPGALAAATTRPMFEAGPTTEAARWMCRRGNRLWGFPLAIVAALGYAGAAWFFYELHHMVTWLFVVLFAYNALKFALVTGWLVLVGVGSVVRMAFSGLARKER